MEHVRDKESTFSETGSRQGKYFQWNRFETGIVQSVEQVRDRESTVGGSGSMQ